MKFNFLLQAASSGGRFLCHNIFLWQSNTQVVDEVDDDVGDVYGDGDGDGDDEVTGDSDGEVNSDGEGEVDSDDGGEVNGDDDGDVGGSILCKTIRFRDFRKLCAPWKSSKKGIIIQFPAHFRKEIEKNPKEISVLGQSKK